MIDIVIPKNNEKELIDMAVKLGYDYLIMLYPKYVKPIASDKLKVFTAVTNAKDRNHFRVVKCGFKDDRKTMELFKPEVMYGFEEFPAKDTFHYKRSGLNQVLCKIAAGKEVTIAFSLQNILSSKRAFYMGRMMQNIMLCTKYKVKTAIASFARDPYEMRSPKDLASLFTVLGMRPEQAKKSLKVLKEHI